MVGFEWEPLVGSFPGSEKHQGSSADGFSSSDSDCRQQQRRSGGDGCDSSVGDRQDSSRCAGSVAVAAMNGEFFPGSNVAEMAALCTIL